MALNEIFLSIASSALYEKLFKNDNTSATFEKLERCLTNASKEFFQSHQEYGYEEDSFLAREENVILILKSMLDSYHIDLINEIKREGFNGNPSVSKEHLNEFLELFYTECKNDYELAKYIDDKKFKFETSLSLKKSDLDLKDLKDDVKKILKYQETPKKIETEWEFYDLKTNKKLDMREQKKYDLKYDNGVVQKFRFDKETVSLENTTPNGDVTYFDYDFDTNTINNLQLHFPLKEFSVSYDEKEVIKKSKQELSDGSYVIHILFKFKNECTLQYNSLDELVGYTLKGDWQINQQEKKFILLN